VKEGLLAQLEQLDTLSREDLLEARYQRLVGYGAYRE
jgi:acetyl-CoA carboxylase alpha subunit